MSPVYEFYCENCKQTTEELFTISKRPNFISCKNCGKRAKSAISSTQFTVNGANAANRYSGDSNYQWMGLPGSEKK